MRARAFILAGALALTAGLALAQVTTNPTVTGVGSSGVATSVTGTTTNDNAAAGKVGEYVESIVSTVAGSSNGVIQDSTTISLTAGDWDCAANVLISNTGTNIIGFMIGISTGTAGNAFSDSVMGSNRLEFFATVGTAYNFPANIVAYRLSLASTTTVRLKTRQDYAAGTATATGRISCRRAR